MSSKTPFNCTWLDVDVLRLISFTKETCRWRDCDTNVFLTDIQKFMSAELDCISVVTERRNDIHFDFMTNVNSTANINNNKLCISFACLTLCLYAGCNKC